jgi:hypothetical protein
MIQPSLLFYLQDDKMVPVNCIWKRTLHLYWVKFFRELPEGVTGAYKLLSNMISLQPSETIPQKNQALNLTKMETKSKTWKKLYLVLVANAIYILIFVSS